MCVWGGGGGGVGLKLVGRGPGCRYVYVSVTPIINITQRNRNVLADISEGTVKYNRLTLSVWNLRPTGVFVLDTLDLPQLFCM